MPATQLRPAADAADPRLAYALPGRSPGAGGHHARPSAPHAGQAAPVAVTPVADPGSPGRARAARRSEILMQLVAGRRARAARGLL